MTTKDGEVKLADFGVAMILNPEAGGTQNNKMLSFAGTPYWMAPEVIKEPSQATSACDIWSLGCTVIELMTGKPPYFDLNPFTAMTNIVNKDRPEFPPEVSPEMSDFLNQCFQKDPKLRSDASTLLRHGLVKQVDKRELE